MVKLTPNEKLQQRLDEIARTQKKDLTLKTIKSLVKERKKFLGEELNSDQALKENKVLLWGVKAISKDQYKPYKNVDMRKFKIKKPKKIKDEESEEEEEEKEEEDENEPKDLSKEKRNYIKGIFENSLEDNLKKLNNMKHDFDIEKIKDNKEKVQEEYVFFTILDKQLANKIMDLKKDKKDTTKYDKIMNPIFDYQSELEDKIDNIFSGDFDDYISYLEDNMQGKGVKGGHPYFLIGSIPKQYRGATMEEAFNKKQISYYGLKQIPDYLTVTYRYLSNKKMDPKFGMNFYIFPLMKRIRKVYEDIEYKLQTKKYKDIKDELEMALDDFKDDYDDLRKAFIHYNKNKLPDDFDPINVTEKKKEERISKTTPEKIPQIQTTFNPEKMNLFINYKFKASGEAFKDFLPYLPKINKTINVWLYSEQKSSLYIIGLLNRYTLDKDKNFEDEKFFSVKFDEKPTEDKIIKLMKAYDKGELQKIPSFKNMKLSYSDLEPKTEQKQEKVKTETKLTTDQKEVVITTTGSLFDKNNRLSPEQAEKLAKKGIFLREKYYHESDIPKYFYQEVSGKGIIRDTFKRIKGFFTGREAGLLPPSVRQFLQDNGQKEITGIIVYRKPIQSFISKTANILTLGEFDRIVKSLGYDSMMHLYMVITFDNQRIGLEKNEVINIFTPPSADRNTEQIEVLIDNPMTFNELFGKTKRYMGPSRFTSYDARKNNCQDFVLSVLISNGLITPQLESFIKQDVETIFKRLPLFDRLAKGATDLAGRVDTLIQGYGVQSILFRKKHWTPESAERWLRMHGYINQGMDPKGHFFRYRQHDPIKYKKLRTHKIDNNIDMIIGYGLMEEEKHRKIHKNMEEEEFEKKMKQYKE